MNKENNTNELTYEAKKAALEDILDNVVNKDVMVAFSGGVDSSALLKLVCSRAAAFHTTVYAVTIHTKLHPVKSRKLQKLPVKSVQSIRLLKWTSWQRQAF